MKTIQLILIFMITVVFASVASANGPTIFDSQAGIYDTLHARLAVNQPTSQAYVKVYLVDEAFDNACWGNQGVMRGISNDNCRIKTKDVIVPGLSYSQTSGSFTYNGANVNNDDLHTDVYYQDVDNGIRVNAVKHVRVRLQHS